MYFKICLLRNGKIKGLKKYSAFLSDLKREKSGGSQDLKLCLRISRGIPPQAAHISIHLHLKEESADNVIKNRAMNHAEIISAR